MSLEIQFKIKNNPNYLRYLRENSYWYKELNRNPASFALFEEKMREDYHLRPVDRFSRIIDSIDMLQTVLSSLK
ncbi:MAG: hypothetical protein E7165_00310 [Firmicutes bacterium]|nr:hypothetical protein [Bacillota bacterium]